MGIIDFLFAENMWKHWHQKSDPSKKRSMTEMNVILSGRWFVIRMHLHTMKTTSTTQRRLATGKNSPAKSLWNSCETAELFDGCLVMHNNIDLISYSRQPRNPWLEWHRLSFYTIAIRWEYVEALIKLLTASVHKALIHTSQMKISVFFSAALMPKTSVKHKMTQHVLNYSFKNLLPICPYRADS